MALCPQAPVGGVWTPLACEYFASTADVYRVLDELPDDLDQLPTADGRDKTAEASCARLARMVGRDAADADAATWRGLAAWFAEQQLRKIFDSAMLVLSRAQLPASAPVVGAGVGRHVLARLAARLRRPYRDFGGAVGLEAARSDWLGHCAPAVAVALLAQDA
jgi:probable H4MPT-linked C1 transfer pathway protein